MSKVYLKIPTLEELKFRQEWMKNPKTMEYNAGLNVNIKGYNYNDGTISWSDADFTDWYNRWIGKEPNKYFAYIYEIENDNIPVGEIYFYYDDESKLYNMGIVISYQNRGKGYSEETLLELEKIAFETYKITDLSDMIAENRIGAIKSFKKAGFVETDLVKEEFVFDEKIKVKHLLLTRELYLINKLK